MGAETCRNHHPSSNHHPLAIQPSYPLPLLDLRYPIFHDQLSHRLGDQSDWTLASVLFDLQEAAASG